MKNNSHTFLQDSPYESPWNAKTKVALLAWDICWTFFCRWTPKPLNPWRLWCLRIFGARIYGTPFVHQRARIQIPWNLILHHRACLGDRTNAYSLAEIEIGEGATIAQEVYLCTGTHNFLDTAMPLKVAKITIGPHAFIGARSFILPGVTIGAHAIVGACSVVSRSLDANTISAGNPARFIKHNRS